MLKCLRKCLPRPHIPGFFKKLFEYGCRFAAPGAGEEQEGAEERRGGTRKAIKAGGPSLAQAAATTKVTQKEATRAATRGVRPRILRCIEDGSAEDFFAVAQSLGEGGGPNMKKWVLLLLAMTCVTWLEAAGRRSNLGFGFPSQGCCCPRVLHLVCIMVLVLPLYAFTIFRLQRQNRAENVLAHFLEMLWIPVGGRKYSGWLFCLTLILAAVWRHRCYEIGGWVHG